MSNSTASPLDSIDVQACEAFEESWKNGRPGRIEDFLPRQETSPNYLATLLQLIKSELWFSWRRYRERADRQETITVSYGVLIDEYFRRFPCLQANPQHVLELAKEEYRIRQLFGDRPPADDYCSRFPEVVKSGREVECVLEKRPESVQPKPGLPGYEVLGELGRGGMGIVYLARDEKLKRLTALKTILSGALADPEYRDRLLREAETVARFQHPNIVQIYEIAEQEGQLYLALEYVDGGNLQTYLKGSPSSAEQAAVLVEKLARAMHYAHQRGIVHRDLKPANILLSREGAADGEPGVPKITDFGLAKQLDSDSGQTHSQAILGTPSYMAPEQAECRQKEIGPLTDVYALGATLYELLTGRPPFKGTSLHDTLDQVRNKEPVAPIQLQHSVPRDLETICLKCLQKQPGRRYTSAWELADDLGRFLRREPIRARPVGRAERVKKWVRRNPALAAFWAVSVAAVCLLIGGITWDLFKTEAHLKELSERHQAIVKANSQAEASRQIAEKESGENLQRLIRLTVATWQRHLGEGDLFGSLLYASEALARDDKDNPQARLHALRMAACLRQAPKLLQVWNHDQAVTQVCFSPDGSLVLTSSLDGTARVWDAVTGKEVIRPLRHEGPVNCAAFSPDGHCIVTGHDNAVCLWDARSGEPLWKPFPLRQPAFHVAFQPGDGKTVLAVSGNKYAGNFWRNTPSTTGTPGIWVPGPPTVTMDRIMTGVGPNGVPQFTTIPRTTPGPMQYIPGTPGLPGHSQEVRPQGEVHFWEVETGQLAGQLRQTGWINFAAFSTDGSRVVTAGGSLEGKRAAAVWDVPRKGQPGLQPRQRLPHPSDIHWAVFSPDGRRVVTASGPEDRTTGEVRVWDLDTEQLVGQSLKHHGPVTQVWFSPDGRRILSASADETARVWDAETGEAITPSLRHLDRLSGAWFSPDGRRVLTASWDGTARVWDSSSGEPLCPLLRHASRLTAAAFAPDGRRVLTADRDGQIRLWDLAADSYQGAFLKHQVVVPPPDRVRVMLTGQRGTLRSKNYLGDVVAASAAFSPDGRFVISGAGTRVIETVPGGSRATAMAEIETHHLCVWGSATGQLMGPPILHQSPVMATTLSPDGSRLLTVSSEGVRLWEMPRGKQLVHRPLEPGARFRWAAFGPDGRCYLVTRRSKTAPKGQKRPLPGLPEDFETSALIVEIRDVESNKLVIPPLEHEAQVEQAILSANGRILVTLMLKPASLDKKNPRFDWVVQTWDLKNEGRPIGPPLKSSSPITQVAVSPDGEHLVTYRPSLSGAPLVVVGALTAEQGGEAFLWHVGSGRQYPLKHADIVTHAAFSPDGRYVVTASADRTGRVWDLKGQPVSPPLQHRARVNHAAFGPDGLVVTASNDHTARVWDLATGEPVSPLLKHDSAVLHAAFSPADPQADNPTCLLVTSDLDGTSRVWDLSPLPASRTPAAPEELKQLAQLLASYRLDPATGLMALDREAVQRAWKEWRRHSPATFTLSPRQSFAWHREEAEKAEREGDWRAAILHLERLSAAEPAAWLFQDRLGRAHARLEQWEQAAGDYARAIELGGDRELLWYAAAVVSLKQGKVADYRRTCAELRRRFGKTKDPAVANTVVRACLLAPEAVPDPGELVQLAEQCVAAKEPNFAPGMLGAALYRAGRFKEAEQRLAAVTMAGRGGTPHDWLFLAMVHHQLGQADQGAGFLDRARNWMDQTAQGKFRQMGARGSLPWQGLELQLLRQEAETLVRKEKR